MERRVLTPGSTLKERYVIDQLLGVGGFGNVYRAWDPLLDCSVAIKEYGENVQKFLTEARLTAGLRSCPNIVYVYDFFEESGAAYIVMEYLQGEKLKDLLKRRGKLSLPEAREIMLPLLAALETVHGAGLLHRDVAPDNIWLFRDGTVKLFDFGCAGKSGMKRQEIEVKSGYSPPEQYRPDALQGPESDIYAAAAVLYRMLSGKEPRPAPERLCRDRMPGEIRKHVRAGNKLRRLLLDGLALKPEQRISSAAVFAEKLRREYRERNRGLRILRLALLGFGLMVPLVKGIRSIPAAQKTETGPAESQTAAEGTGEPQKAELQEAELQKAAPRAAEPKAAESGITESPAEVKEETAEEISQETESPAETESEKEKESEKESEKETDSGILKEIKNRYESETGTGNRLETEPQSREETAEPKTVRRETMAPESIPQEAPTVPDL